MDVSVVIPLFNEEQSLPELAAWISRVAGQEKFSYEIIFVDDGSSDGSWLVVEQLAKANPFIRAIRFRQNYGKSAALHCGFEAARGEVVITLDADLQDSPDEIPALYRMIREEGFDLVSGWKKKRYDPLTKTIPTKLYNSAIRWMTGIKLHDSNCGIKAYKKDVIKTIEVYGEMHRYIPVMAKRAGFNKIGEKVVVHQKRKYGKTKFGLERFTNGLLDLLSIMFISKFGKRPMHLFGTAGIFVFMLGFAAAGYLGAQKIYYLQHQIKARLLTDSPYFYFAIMAMIIGTQLFLAGFLGELISRNSSERNHYKIAKTIG